MTQLSMGVMACQPGSKFAKAYADGIHKSKYWDPTFEDAIDVCAKISRIASIVFHNVYKDVSVTIQLSDACIIQNKNIPDSDPSLDYGANYAQMLGFQDTSFWELMRLYLVLHA